MNLAFMVGVISGLFIIAVFLIAWIVTIHLMSLRVEQVILIGTYKVQGRDRWGKVFSITVSVRIPQRRTNIHWISSLYIRAWALQQNATIDTIRLNDGSNSPVYYGRG